MGTSPTVSVSTDSGASSSGVRVPWDGAGCGRGCSARGDSRGPRGGRGRDGRWCCRGVVPRRNRANSASGVAIYVSS